MLIKFSNEDIQNYVSDLCSIPPLISREVVAIHFSKNRAGVMIGNVFQPTYSGVIITKQNGIRVPPPPSPKKVLKISTWGEAANPQIEEVEIVKKSNKKILHNPYAPLEIFLKSKEDNVIDFDGKLKNEVRELEEIFDYLNDAKRIEISEDRLTLNEIMKKPYLKYCMLMLLREFKMRLL